MTFTSGLTWIPLYIALIYLVIKNNENMSQIFLIIGCAVGCIFLADGIADYIVKPLVGRERPTNDPLIKYTIDVVNNYRESNFSFFSAHAANTMSLAVFLSLVIRSNPLNYALIIWSLLNCWTRLYLGVHYPSDILVGIIWGVIVGFLFYMIYRKIYLRISPKLNYVSSYYTSTGYSHDDINIVFLVISLELAYIIIWGGIRYSM
ncbi:MAG: phosphatase PAP2 family protein [Prevotella sp.]|nr:phosphatase PAP2 family protein [Prevotella sp.]